jgi:hypothetical protein
MSTSFKPKQLAKGGKPIQAPCPMKAVIEENKAFLKDLFTGDAAPIVGARVVSMHMAHQKRTASAALMRAGVKSTVLQASFGTDTDYIIETDAGGETVVPQRFLTQRSEVHPDLFKEGDVVITRVNGCTKNVNFGLWSGELTACGRGWHEVYAWIPAEKVARALKEGRITLVADDLKKRQEEAAALAAKEAAVQAKLTAEILAGVEQRKAEAEAKNELVDGEELGSW